MYCMPITNHRLLLAARPAGIPRPLNFAADALPARMPGPGEVMLFARLVADLESQSDMARIASQIGKT